MSSDNIPDVLYHYTDLNAAQNILTKKQVWATDYRYLNDSNELIRAREHFFQKVAPLIEDNQGARFSSYLLDDLNIENAFYCIASFSQSKEILSQWRGYANDGKGVAIGLRKSMLENENVHSLKCTYNNPSEEVDRIIDENSHKFKELEYLHQKLFDNKFSAENVIFQDKIQEIKRLFISELLRIKHPAFAEEQEIRMVVYKKATEIKTRTSGDNSLIIPYTPIDLVTGLDHALHSITLGPKCDKRNIKAFELMFDWLPNTTQIEQFNCGYR